jgi:hypothetical protein
VARTYAAAVTAHALATVAAVRPATPPMAAAQGLRSLRPRMHRRVWALPSHALP